jgi:HSP20 family protein
MTTHLYVPRRNASSVAALGWPDFDRVFDQLRSGLGHPARVAAASYTPRIDFTETDTEMRVAAELPGLEEKDIEVSLEEGVLTIRGERADEEQSADAKGVRHVFETYRGKFQRSLRLPSEVEADAVKAVYRNGILTVTLPKLPEAQPSVRSIPVTAGS